MKTASLLEVWATAVSLMLGLAACAGDAGQRSSARYIDDKTIATRVNAALLADQLIRVAAYKGVIKESGRIESPEPAWQAELVAEEVGGGEIREGQLADPAAIEEFSRRPK